jgi:hypothetical protein
MPPHHSTQPGDLARDASRSSHRQSHRKVRRNFALQPTRRLRAWIRLQLELDVPEGYRVCESATRPSRAASPLREHFTRGFRNFSRAHTKAPTARRASKEVVPEYDSDSNTVTGYNSDSNPLSGFYSDSSYEFDFGSDPDEPESENNTTEQPLSGPASVLVITSTPAGRFVYWPDRKPADLTGGNSRCVSYLNSLPFQEGTPLAPAREHTPTEVATSDSSLGSPDRQVFMTTNKAPGPSGIVPDQYLEDISADELSANAPADETDAKRDARRERNRNRNERC